MPCGVAGHGFKLIKATLDMRKLELVMLNMHDNEGFVLMFLVHSAITMHQAFVLTLIYANIFANFVNRQLIMEM